MPAYLQIFLRAIISYLVLLVMTRMMGKREISQMTFFDYIVGITIGSLTAVVATDIRMNWYDALPALLVFGAFQIISAFFSMKSIKFRKLVDGSSTVLIKNGKILEENLAKERLNTNELMFKLQEKNVFKLADVETAILETDGEVSVQKKSNKRSLTPSDMSISTQYDGLPRLIIEDGNIIGESLKDIKMTRSWLMSKLASQGVYDISKVMMAQVDTNGNLYIDLYEDFPNKSKPDLSKKILLAKLEKISSDLKTYELDTKNIDGKKLYKDCTISIENIISQFKLLLQKNNKS